MVVKTGNGDQGVNNYENNELGSDEVRNGAYETVRSEATRRHK